MGETVDTAEEERKLEDSYERTEGSGSLESALVTSLASMDEEESCPVGMPHSKLRRVISCTNYPDVHERLRGRES